MAKCIDWEYPPWPDQAAIQLHQACTRMARADYCGSGVSNTVDDTLITWYGIAAVPQTGGLAVPADPSNGAFHIEAAWRPTGAVCLSKQRWASMAPGNACQGSTVLPDWRSAHKGSCDDTTVADLQKSGALFVQYSMFIDAALYRFENKQTGGAITTAAIDMSAWPPRLDAKTFDAATVAAYTPVLPVQPLGALVSTRVDQGALLTTIDHSALKAVLRYKDGSGRYATLAAGDPLPSGYGPKPDGTEGYVLVQAQTGKDLTLGAWTKGPVVVTATSAPAGVGSDAYHALGYLPGHLQELSGWLALLLGSPQAAAVAR
jgi:hypothetical protein